jgi:chromosome segregation ATPase
MKPKIQPVVLITVACLLAANAYGDDARLKETLRTLTLRLRSAETERNNLLSDKAQLEQEKKTLTTKVEALTKQAAADKEKLDSLTSKASDQEKALLEAKDSLGKWKAAYEQVAVDAKNSEAERSRLAEESIGLKRKLEDRERKNLALFKVGNEILTRYEKFGLGEALAAREPFTGVTRAKLESLVQDYHDKLADQRVKPQ